MDWIEQLFGVSPDNGDGSLEMVIALAVTVAVAIVILALSPTTRRAVFRRVSKLLGNHDRTPLG